MFIRYDTEGKQFVKRFCLRYFILNGSTIDTKFISVGIRGKFIIFQSDVDLWRYYRFREIIRIDNCDRL